jgi:hypothetical protein
MEHLLHGLFNAEDKPTLGRLIGIAREQKTPPISEAALYLCTSVNDLGNDGAHHAVELDERDVRSAIHNTAVVLNEIYLKKPASQSGPGSNAP